MLPIPQVFRTMINPESYKRDHTINYSKDKALGKLAPELKYNNYTEEKISFDIVVDGTGVVDKKKVDDHIALLKNVVYKYNGIFHEPSIVKLLWGTMVFYGRLTAMNTTYILFDPDGNPLRAKISLSFSQYVSPKEESKRANRSSPDLTHAVTVKDGDTLPLLCHRIYSNPGLYLQVARYNALSDFRNIAPGTLLQFPPLQKLGLD
jgi:hypothetical protein